MINDQSVQLSLIVTRHLPATAYKKEKSRQNLKMISVTFAIIYRWSLLPVVIRFLINRWRISKNFTWLSKKSMRSTKKNIKIVPIKPLSIIWLHRLKILENRSSKSFIKLKIHWNKQKIKLNCLLASLLFGLSSSQKHLKEKFNLQ
jgi:hypothetical protein